MVYVIQVFWQQAVSIHVWHISLLCVQRKTPDGGQRKCPKHVEFYSKNKFEKLVHLVSFIIRICHDARSPERQIYFVSCDKLPVPAPRVWLNCASTPVAPCAEIVSSLMPQALFFLWLDSPSRPPHCWGFAITLRHTRFGRTPLDEWSTRRQDLYLKTHNTHKSVVCFQVEVVIRTRNPINRDLLLDCAAILNCYNNNNNTVIPWRMYTVYCPSDFSIFRKSNRLSNK